MVGLLATEGRSVTILPATGHTYSVIFLQFPLSIYLVTHMTSLPFHCMATQQREKERKNERERKRERKRERGREREVKQKDGLLHAISTSVVYTLIQREKERRNERERKREREK